MEACPLKNFPETLAVLAVPLIVIEAPAHHLPDLLGSEDALQFPPKPWVSPKLSAHLDPIPLVLFLQGFRGTNFNAFPTPNASW
jgi:hypothetical protein